MLADYIKAGHEKGHNLTFMSIVIAAFVRTVSQCPELNRFIMNKQIYARNRISVSFVVLRRSRGRQHHGFAGEVDLKHRHRI